LRCDGCIHVVIRWKIRGERGTMGESIPCSSPLFFEAGLKPTCRELEDVLWLYALDVSGQVSDESVKGGHNENKR
jgi:hypothetical protein